MVALNLDKLTAAGLNIGNDSEAVTLLIMGGLIGGIFPDIDNPRSSMGYLTKPVSTILGKFSEFTGKTGVNHRGIFHDFTLYIAGLILSYLYFPPMLGFFLGAISHLFLDAFNPMGVPLFFGIRTLHLGKIYATGKGAIAFTWLAEFAVLGVGIFIKTMIIYS
jgi:membrane-bound metal-dependent hydrolase YbcI (DUF457 family)